MSNKHASMATPDFCEHGRLPIKAKKSCPACLAELEVRVDGAESDGGLARWKFGSLLRAEREANGGEQLPAGRMAEIVELTGKSAAEIRNRMQFATEYAEAEVANALATFGSWHGIVAEGLGERSQKPPNYWSVLKGRAASCLTAYEAAESTGEASTTPDKWNDVDKKEAAEVYFAAAALLESEAVRLEAL